MQAALPEILSTDEEVPLSVQNDITDIKRDVAVIRERLDWHFRIGAGAILVFTGLFGWLVTSYLPGEFAHERRDVQLQFDKLTTLQLNKLSTEIDAIQQSGRKMDPRTVALLGNSLLKFTTSDSKEVSQRSWDVENQILGYSSTLVPFSDVGYVTFRAPDNNEECIVDRGKTQNVGMVGFVFEHCTQHLDSILGPEPASRGMVYKFLAFRDAKIIYSGGPLRLDGVVFVNCTFELQSGNSSRQLAETLLAENPVKHLDLP
jgi:hypothetical protein